MKTRIAVLVVMLGTLIGGMTTSWAQTASGNVYGTITDESGAVLPGATITISGATLAPRTTVSDPSGSFRFLNLDPSSYQMSVTLGGFATVNRTVSVNTGQNVELRYSLKVSSVEETVTVTSEQPIIDTKKVGTGTTLTKEELSQIPNSRDPWAVLRTIPGVVVDRVNIAGNESGQQSMFVGKGSAAGDAMWNLDGVVITDMAAAGASPTYFDYDAFDEINVSTGGNDLKVATGGIGLNLVTKRGTNNFHGAFRGYFTHRDLQGKNIKGTELENDPRLCLAQNANGTCGSFSDKADHIDQVSDYGVDIGGPIVKDKLWFWGSYGKQDIRNVRTNQTKDKTLLKDYNAKLNWQMSASDMFSVFYFLGAKEKFGRSPGFPGISNEADSFLWNQGGYYPGGPHGLIKAELNHTFSPNLYGNLKYAYYGTGFNLSPRGGLDQSGGVDFNEGTSVGSYLFFGTKRPQHVVNADFNYFATATGGSHEFKFGFGYRRAPVTSTTAFGGDKLFALKSDATSGYAYVTRDRAFKVLNQYAFGYVGDTFTKDRLTLNAGVRFDYQTGKNQPSAAAANPAFPQVLGALDFDGRGVGAKWTDLSPRVGFTYALDESRKTLVRASFARYAGQLSSSDPSFDNPNTGYGYLAYLWNDLNDDGRAQPGELDLGSGVQYSGPGDPRNPVSSNTIDPNYKANHDTEWILGLDRELAANLALSVAYTHKKASDITAWTPRIGLTRADYVETPFSVVRGDVTYTGSQFAPDPAKVAASGNGRILQNRPDYSRTYDGVEINLVKRLSNKWMTRIGYSYMNWVENYEGPAAIQNPTRTDTTTNTFGTGGFAGPSFDGGQVAIRSTGSGKGDIFPAPKWQLTASALYQLPAGFEVSTAIFARQGYPRPQVAQRSVPGEGNLRILVSPKVDTVRYEDLWNVDLRLSKNLRLGGSMNAVLAVDCFNVLNASTELNRVRNVSSSAFGRLDELLSPRVFRLGMRLQF